MSQETIYILIVVMALVCVGLLMFIKKHYGVIRDAKVQEAEQQARVQKRYDEQRAYLIESIQVISRAVGNDEKLTYTEACMRLTALIEALAPHLLQHADFAVIYEVYKRTEHIPIKEDWKKLSRQKQWAYKKEMAKIEAEFSAQVDKATKKLAVYDFNLMLH